MVEILINFQKFETSFSLRTRKSALPGISNANPANEKKLRVQYKNDNEACILIINRSRMYVNLSFFSLHFATPTWKGDRGFFES